MWHRHSPVLTGAGAFSRLVGTDISAGMIDAAERKAQTSPYRDRIELRVDAAEELTTVNDGSVDVVRLSVGAFEHMLDRGQVVCQGFAGFEERRRVCALDSERRRLLLVHLSGAATGDLDAPFLHGLFPQFGGGRPPRAIPWPLFDRSRFLWTFIPKGDMPGWTAAILEVLDRLGRIFRLGIFRGGMILTAIKNG